MRHFIRGSHMSPGPNTKLRPKNGKGIFRKFMLMIVLPPSPRPRATALSVGAKKKQMEKMFPDFKLHRLSYAFFFSSIKVGKTWRFPVSVRKKQLAYLAQSPQAHVPPAMRPSPQGAENSCYARAICAGRVPGQRTGKNSNRKFARRNTTYARFALPQQRTPQDSPRPIKHSGNTTNTIIVNLLTLKRFIHEFPPAGLTFDSYYSLRTK